VKKNPPQQNYPAAIKEKRDRLLGSCESLINLHFEIGNCHIPAGSWSTDICGATVSMNSSSVHDCG